jgi:hypothetical protein
MKRDERLQSPVEFDPTVRIVFAAQEDPDVEAAIDSWLRSLLDSPAAPDEARRS